MIYRIIWTDKVNLVNQYWMYILAGILQKELDKNVMTTSSGVYSQPQSSCGATEDTIQLLSQAE